MGKDVKIYVKEKLILLLSTAINLMNIQVIN